MYKWDPAQKTAVPAASDSRDSPVPPPENITDDQAIDPHLDMPHRTSSGSSDGGVAVAPSHHYSSHHYDRHSRRAPGPYDRPSPPPAIATLPPPSHSPSPSHASLEHSRSAVGTPVGRKGSPPHTSATPPVHGHGAPPPSSAYSYPPPPPPGAEAGGYSLPGLAAYHHPSSAPSSAPPGSAPPPSPYGYPMYAHHMPPPMYGHPYSMPPPPHSYAYPPPPPPHQQAGMIGPGSAPPSANYPITYTEDASTKLSDRVRRRCFNCCTTDTSTWRRSNLSPGKVLCNKCGLFERTHSRPRPEQFPHKRGVVGTSPPIHADPLPLHSNGSSGNGGLSGPGTNSTNGHSSSRPTTPYQRPSSSASGAERSSPSMPASSLPPRHSHQPKATGPGSNHGSPRVNGGALPPIQGQHPLANSVEAGSE